MNFIVFDLEATCWRGRPPKGITEIIEIGAYKINRYSEVTDTFSQFVKPIVNPQLSGFCKKLTSIEQENVDGAQTFDKVIDQFIEWGEIDTEDYVLCSWGHDDAHLLRNDCYLHKIEEDWTYHFIDIKKRYSQIKGLKNASGLKSTVKKEGFEFDGPHHRAISDAANLAKIFIKYFEEWDIMY